MQATAMGIFYLLEGSGNVFFVFLPHVIDTSTALSVFVAVGVIANTVGLILLIALEKTLDLGLKTS